MSNTDHVVVDQVKNHGCFTLRCNRCGEEVAIKLPVSIDAFVTVTPAFTRKHAKCEETKCHHEWSRSLPYADRCIRCGKESL